MDVGTLTGSIDLQDDLSSALTVITARVKQFASNVDGALGGVSIAATVAVTAIAAVATSIIALGNRGSEVNDVANSLDQFAGSAENASNIMERMRAGTLGTVDNFTLMKDASKLLSAGVKLSADDFGTLTEAAFVLQNQGFGPTKQVLESLSSALLRGSDRTTRLMGITVDAAAASKKYAESHGIVGRELDALEKKEAMQLGLLDAFRAKTQAAGKQQRDFGEQMEYAVTAIKNWGDALAARVASSTAVTDAVTAIGDALKKAFGGSSQTLMDWAVKWIDRFAGAVAEYGPLVIAAVGSIRDKIVAVYHAVKDAWDAVPEWFRNIAKQAIIAGAAVGVVGIGMGGLSAPVIIDNIGSLSAMWTVFGSKVLLAAAAVKTFMGTIVLTYSIGGLISVLAGVAAGFAALAASTGGIILLLGGLVLASKEVWNGFQEFRNYKGSAWDYLKPNPAADNWLKRLLGIGKAARDARDEVERLAQASAGDTDSWQMSLYQTRDQAQGVGQPRASSGTGGRIGGLSDEIKSLAATLSGAALQKKVDELTAAWKRLNPAQQAVAISSGRLMDVLKPLGEQGGKLAGQLRTLYESHKLLNTQLPVTTDAYKALFAMMRNMTSIKMVAPPLPPGMTDKLSTDPYGILKGVQKSLIMSGQALSAFTPPPGQEKLFDVFGRKIKDSIADGVEKSKLKMGELLTTLSIVSDGFVKMAQIAHGRMAEILSGIGQMFVGLEMATKMVAQVGGAKSNKDGALIGGNWGVGSVLFSDTASGAQKASAAIAGASAVVGGAMNIWASSTHDANAAHAALGGAMQGAQAGAMFGPWGAAIGAVSGALLGLVGASKAARNAVVDFAKTFDTAAKGSGFDELRQKLLVLGDEGERLWIQLTQTAKGMDQVKAAQQAITDALKAYETSGRGLAEANYKTKDALKILADQAKATYDYMLEAGTYTAESLADAWEKYRKAQSAAMGTTAVDDIVAGFPTRAQLQTAASNAEAAYIRIRDSGLYTAGQVERAFLAWQDAMIEAGDAGTIAMRKLDEELKGLIESVKDEAPEEVMGVVEAAARARIAAIELERAAAGVQIAEQQTAEQAASAAAARAADEATEHIHSRAVDLDDRLRKMFAKGYEIPIWFNSGGSTPPHAPSSGAGGSVSSSGGGGTAVINIDGETFARVIVPRIPGVVQSYGLG